MLATITIHMAPEIQLGPLTLAWHGITIAIGLLVAGVIAGHWARHQRLDTEPLWTLAAWMTLGAVLGARIFYLLEHDPGGLLSPSTLVRNRGFTFDGGLILGGVFAAGYLRWRHLSWRYLDAVAFAIPIGIAIGRIGDVINGEHYGAPSNFLLAVRNAHPDALTPNPAIAYQNGGLYEIVLGLLVFAAIWPVRYRMRSPLQLGWIVMGAFAAGRFVEFFLRSDSPTLALGLSNAQWTSLVLLAISLGGFALTLRARPAV